jgi:hypothetical protein
VVVRALSPRITYVGAASSAPPFSGIIYQILEKIPFSPAQQLYGVKSFAVNGF